MSEAASTETIRSARVVGVAALGVLAVAADFVFEGWLLDFHDGHRGGPSRATLASAVWWLAWIPLALPLVRACERHARATRSRAATVASYVVMAAGFALARGLIAAPLWLIAAGAPPARNYGALSELVRVVWWAILRTPSGILEALAFAAVFHVFRSARLAQKAALVEARLQETIVRAELDALRTRLEPHFLFNALNGITAFVRTDPVAAEAMIGKLSRFLRAVLELRSETLIPVQRELDLIRAYLEIQQIRFGDRLTWMIDAEPGVLGRDVPPMLLQPLVENALNHGIARRVGGGTLAVSAAVSDGFLCLHVEEAAMTSGDPSDRGAADSGLQLGLSTTRERLRRLYGDTAAVELETGPGRSRSTALIPTAAG